MADPDEALIEAIAEAIHAGCDPRRHDGLVTTVHEWEARAALAAMVAHLGLVEETKSGCGHHIGNRFKPEHHDRWVKRRLVSRWVEVDHGSE